MYKRYRKMMREKNGNCRDGCAIIHKRERLDVEIHRVFFFSLLFHMGTGRKRGGGGFNALILHIILKLGALLKNQSIAAPFYNIPSDGWLPIQHPIPLSFFFVFHGGITGTLQPAVNLPLRENVVGV
jgi:hypothetical protein